MTRFIALFVLLLVLTQAYAALPPQYQNAKDLDVMIEFVKQHPSVISSLKQIDLRQSTVYFGEDCEAVFGRKLVIRMPGWVGPAAPLEFKRSNCELD
jgi:hypothetical protein